MPTQAERRAATRRSLLEAAGAVFAERGYHGASLDAIAARAGASKGSVYHHFASKHELFAALLTDRIAARLEEIRAGAPGTGGATGFARAASDPRWAPLFFEFVAVAARDDAVRPAFAVWLRDTRAMLAELIVTQLPPTTMPPERLAILVSALANGMLIEMTFDDDVPPQALAEALELLAAAATTGGSGGSATPRGA